MEIVAQSTQKYLHFLHPSYVSAVTTYDLFGLTEVELLSILFIGAGIIVLMIILSYYLIKKYRTA